MRTVIILLVALLAIINLQQISCQCTGNPPPKGKGGRSACSAGDSGVQGLRDSALELADGLPADEKQEIISTFFGAMEKICYEISCCDSNGNGNQCVLSGFYGAHCVCPTQQL